jgi:hypothetical protein
MGITSQSAIAVISRVGDGRCRFGNLDRKASAFCLEDFILKNVARILCVFFVLISPAIAQQKPPRELQAMIEQLDKTAADIVRDPWAGSFAIGLVQRSGLVWARSYGYADIEKRIPANPDSVYRIGSITKQFTALMFLQLVHDGVVQCWLPGNGIRGTGGKHGNHHSAQSEPRMGRQEQTTPPRLGSRQASPDFCR